MNQFKRFVLGTVAAFGLGLGITSQALVLNGERYSCTNACVIDLGPPVTIRDCCGGHVWKEISSGIGGH